MTDSQSEVSGAAGAGNINRNVALRSIAFSLTVNALCPYLLYRLLAPHFPDESVLPLLYSSIFPVIGFVIGVLRKRMVDVISVIALAGIMFHVSVTVLSPNLSTALVVRSFQGAIIGTCFLVSAAIGRPVILYVARQLVTAGTPERQTIFNAAVAADRGHTFRAATTVWGGGLVLMSAVHVLLAAYLPHAQFVLISPVLGVGTDILLLAWSTRYTARRMAGLMRAARQTL